MQFFEFFEVNFGLGPVFVIILLVAMFAGVTLILFGRLRAKRQGNVQLQDWWARFRLQIGVILCFSFALSLLFYSSSVKGSRRNVEDLMRKIENKVAAGHLKFLSNKMGRTTLANTLEHMLEEYSIYESERTMDLVFQDQLSPEGCVLAEQTIRQVLVNPSSEADSIPIKIRYSGFAASCESVTPIHVRFWTNERSTPFSKSYVTSSDISQDVDWIDTTLEILPGGTITVERRNIAKFPKNGHFALLTVRPIDGDMSVKVSGPNNLKCHYEFYNMYGNDPVMCPVDSVPPGQNGRFEFTLKAMGGSLPGNGIELLWDWTDTLTVADAIK